MAKIKRLFNDPYDIVEEMVEGYVGAHKQYVKMCDLDEAQGRVVLANDAGTKDKVGVIIGGGSGHEPLFIGYVGEDFADAVTLTHPHLQTHATQQQKHVITEKDVFTYMVIMPETL